MTVLARWLHYLVAKPWIYDRVQTLAGAEIVSRHLAATLRPYLRPGMRVVDVGGGTGLARSLFPLDSTYVCLDNDPTKLEGFLKKDPKGLAVLSGATRMPIKSASIDLVLCRFISHHLPDDLLPGLFRESARVLNDAGRLIFVDPLWTPTRPIARMMWRYDRGSFPRTEAALMTAISVDCQIESWERFAVFHQYALGVAKPVRPPHTQL
jgi:ubiquinone/menaquinone biosynthesis C-methylase UbiE